MSRNRQPFWIHGSNWQNEKPKAKKKYYWPIYCRWRQTSAKRKYVIVKASLKRNVKVKINIKIKEIENVSIKHT